MQAQSAKDGAGGAGVDMIVPMPSSGDGLKMLVERVAKETGLGYQTDVLQETGVKTREQKKVYSAKARLWNVHGAFEVKNPGGIEGKNILLIDDVMTTGSTVAEVRKILVDAGANSVEVLLTGMPAADQSRIESPEIERIRQVKGTSLSEGPGVILEII